MGSSPPPAWEPTEQDIALVLNVLRKHLPGHPAAHADLVQRVLLEAMRVLNPDAAAPGPIPPHAPHAPPGALEPPALLIGITRNLIKAYVREQAKLAEIPEDEAPEIY